INKIHAREMIGAFSTPLQIQKALDDLKAYWSDLLSAYTVQTSDEKLNRMVNIWNQYQCMTTFNMSRSASYFESGIGRGMGFRDSNQDLLSVVHQIPERARQRIIDLASTQFPDGSAYHQYQPLTKRGNHDIGSGFNDDPLWLILAVAAYVKETGDYDILKEQVPFDNNPANCVGLFEHLERSFYHVVNNLGPHKLPLIGRADWNDCLNLNCFSSQPDESFQTTSNQQGRTAESVLIAGMFVFIGDEYVKLCDWLGYDEKAREAARHVEQMRHTVMEHGVDDAWFLRAYDFYGKKIGSRENEEGQIFIESQGFCVMAGIGVESGFAQKALDSVKERLDTKYGIVLLNPAYTRYHLELGEVSSYPPGYKENAGVFCHNNPWIMIAETVLGRSDQALAYYRKIAPAYLEDISEIHRMEPYVYSQMVAGKDAVRHGEAKNSWLTGTAAWNFVAISQYILGIRPEHNGLLIQPCMSAELSDYTMVRKCRGTEYRISVRNNDGGPLSLRVNGVPFAGNVVPFGEPGDVINVECSPAGIK
ncbi:MAG TPA: hypothetical protein VKQ72_21310, partial [Aggregatilineales bacterium]|nr:hypothetical protein [Aggregatilineales bacterium]